MAAILHADFDAFYASVEQRDDPALRGKPVVVGGDPETRGVVAAASYEVREFGVRSAMPMKTAMRLCPHAIRVPPRFEVYRDVSRAVMEIFRVVTPLVEPLSLDEAFLDVTNRVDEDWTPERIARGLKGRIKKRTRLTISIGVASSKSVAKIASDMDKPDGLTVVALGTERAFLAQLPVGRLWGIGPKTQERLALEKITTIGQLAEKPEDWFIAQFGKTGTFFRDLANGVDDRPVIVERRRKSLSAETTLAVDSGDAEQLTEIVERLSARVGGQLERRGLSGRTVKLKLRLEDFTTFTRQVTLDGPVSSPQDVGQAALAMLRRELDADRRFRLIGVGVSGFEAPGEAEEENPLQPRLAGLG
jgi:DNA polymerase IV